MNVVGFATKSVALFRQYFFVYSAKKVIIGLSLSSFVLSGCSEAIPEFENLFGGSSVNKPSFNSVNDTYILTTMGETLSYSGSCDPSTVSLEVSVEGGAFVDIVSTPGYIGTDIDCADGSFAIDISSAGTNMGFSGGVTNEVKTVSLRAKNAEGEESVTSDFKVAYIGTPANLNYVLGSDSTNENISSKAIEVQIDSISLVDTLISVSESALTATSSADYILPSSTITIPAGSTIGTIMVQIMDDNISENSETFNVHMDGVTANATIGASTHVHTVNDNESVPSVSFFSSADSSLETVGSANVVVTLSNPAEYVANVDIASTDGSAQSVGDYTAVLTNLTFSSLQTVVTVPVTITDDSLYEGTQDFTLSLSNPTNVSIGATTVHNHDILDNEEMPTLKFDLATASTGENLGPALVPVSLSGTTEDSVTVNYAVTGGTATGGGTDYTLPAGVLTFSGGTTSMNLTIALNDDALADGNETVQITLSGNSTNATLGADTHTHTIMDNEGPPTVFMANSVSSPGEAIGSHNILVNMSGPAGVPVTVDYAATDGSATGAGIDYTVTSGTLTFPPGVVVATISATIDNDNLFEGDESFNVTLSNVAGGGAALGSPNVHAVTISDDETGVFDFVLSNSNGSEATNPAQIVVSLSSPAPVQYTVDYNITGGSATSAGTDYTLALGTLTFPALSTLQTISIPINNDNLYEDDETIDLQILNPSGNSSLGGTVAHTYTINDDETIPVLQFSSSTGATLESATSANIVVTLSGPAQQDVTVNYASSDIATEALSSVDYAATSGTLTFSSGSTLPLTIPVTFIDDSVFEDDEDFQVVLSGNSANSNLGGSTHTHSITNNEATPVLQFSVASSNSVESVGTENILISLNPISENDVTVDCNSTGGTASSGVDYSPVSSTITIAAGSTTGICGLSITNDSIDEPGQTIELSLSNASALSTLGAITSHTYTINDDDATPTTTFGISTGSGFENVGNHIISVTLSGPSENTILVPFSVDGSSTALNPGDYSSPGSAVTLTFSALDTSEDLTINVIDDITPEVPETLTLLMGTPTNAGVGAIDSYTFTITDDDIAPYTWTGLAGDSDWTNAGNWSTNVVPGTNDIAIFNSACTSCNATMNSAINVGGIKMDTTYTGTISQATGVNVDIGSDGWEQEAGTFVGSDSNISIGSTGFDLSGGSFTASNANLDIDGPFFSKGGVFNSNSSSINVFSFQTESAPSISVNSSLVTFIGGISGELVDASGVTFGDVSFNRTGGYIDIKGTMVVSGDLEFNYTGTIRNGGSGVIEYSGDLVQTNGSSDFASPITIRNVGSSGISNYTYNAGSLPSFEVARTGGALNINGPLTINNNLTYSTGTINWNSGTLGFEGANPSIINLGSQVVGIPLLFAKSSGSVSIVGNLDIDDDVTINQSTSIDGGVLFISGDLNVTDAGGGSTEVRFVGNADPQLVSVLSGTLPEGTFRVNKPAGTLRLASNLTLSGVGQDFRIFNGKMELDGNTLQVSDEFQLDSGTTFVQNCGTLTAAVTTILGNHIIGNEVDLSIADDSVSEGLQANTVASVTPLNCMDTIFQVDTGDNTATAGTDYTAVASVLYTIPAASGVVTIPVSTTDDVSVESSENFVVNLSNLPAGVTPSDVNATVTILDNDNPTINIVDVIGIEGNNALVTVSLTSNASATTTFNYATSDNTAFNGSDYTAASGTGTIFVGNNITTLTIPLLTGGGQESDETFTVTLSGLVNATAGDLTGLVTVKDEFMPNPLLNLNDPNSFSGSFAGQTNINAVISNDSTANKWCLSESQSAIPSSATCTGGTTWVETQPTAFTLSSTDGAKIVYLWTQDSLGRVNEGPVSYSIQLDETPPTLPTAPLLGAVPASLVDSPILNWSDSTDGGSGIYEYRVAIYTAGDGLVSTYAPHNSGNPRSGLSLTDGADYKFRVYAVDTAGNESGFVESSTWTATASTGSPQTKVLDLSLYNITSNSFQVLSNVEDDIDSDKVGMTLWYCNETDSPGCLATSGTSVSLTFSGSFYESTVSGLSPPNNPGDTLNVEIVMDDPDGVVNNNLTAQVILSPSGVQEFSHVYRSVGQASIVDDDDSMAESASFFIFNGEMRVKFSKNMNDDLGIGDALQYDADGDTTIDDVAIVKKRMDRTTYIVQAPDGSVPNLPSVNPSNRWSVYRVFLNLANTDSLDSTANINSNIDSSIRSMLVLGKDLVNDNREVTFAVYKGTADTSTNVNYNGWTTDTTRKVNLLVPEKYTHVGDSQRHDGKPLEDDNVTASGYTGSHTLTFTNLNDFTMEGFVIQDSSTLSMDIQGTGSVRISRNIFEKQGTSSSRRLLNFAAGLNDVVIDNNIFYLNSAVGRAISMSNGASIVKVLHNTLMVYGTSSRALDLSGSGGTLEVVNNLFLEGVSNNFFGFATNNFNGNAKNNANNLSLSAANVGPLNFVNATYKDFRLTVADTNALLAVGIDSGTVKNKDLEYKPRNRHIPGALRGKSRNIYRSVAEGANTPLYDDGGGSNQVSINSATGSVSFNNSVPNNVGIGDVVDIPGSGIAILTKRLSASSFEAASAAGNYGGLPDVTNHTDFNVCRAYSSLLDAENGDENLCVSAGNRNFDTWSGGKNIVTSNENWNLALYGASGVATNATTFNGWTTSKDNIVRLYTPAHSSEVGTSQRHTGIFNTALFYMNEELRMQVNHFVLDGIQCELVTNTGGQQCLRANQGANGTGVIMNSIVRFASGSTGATSKGITNYGDGDVIIANNIVYGFNTVSSSAVSSYLASGKMMLIGNTLHNSNQCYYDNIAGYAPFAMNNICSASTMGFVDNDGFDSGSNINIHDGGATAPGSLSYQNANVNYVNTSIGSEDLHLAVSGAQIAEGNGVNMQANMDDFWEFLKFDIDGQNRHDGNSWNIGADD